MTHEAEVGACNSNESPHNDSLIFAVKKKKEKRKLQRRTFFLTGILYGIR